MIKSGNFLIIFFFCLSLASAEDSVFLNRTIERINNTLKDLKSPLQTPTCQSLQQEAFNCQKVLDAIDGDAASDGFLGLLESRYPICEKYLPPKDQSAAFKPEDLLMGLQSHFYPHFSNETTSLISSCARNADDKKSKKMIAAYFYLFGLMDEAARSSLSTLAEIDSLTGNKEKNMLAALDCQSGFSETFVKECRSIKKSCKVKSNLSEVSAQTDRARLDIQKADQEIRRLEKNKTLPENEKRIGELKMGIALLQDQFPWITGETFISLKSRRSVTTERAIKAELAEVSAASEMKLIAATDAMKCIKGVSPLKKCPQIIKDALSKIPSFKNRAINYKDKKAVLARQYLEFNDCAIEGLKDRDATSAVLQESAVGAALTVATLGTSAALSGARAVNSLRLMKIAETAQKGMQAANTADSALSMKNAIEACSASPEIEQTKVTDNSCPLENIVSAKIKNQNSCVAQLLLSSVGMLNLKLLAPAIKTPVINLEKAAAFTNEERLMAAKNVIGKKLSSAQEQAVLKSHEVGSDKGYFEYSFSELREKMRILTSAGFSPDEADKLMRHGITGTTAPLKQDPLSLRFIDRKSSEFLAERKKILSQEKVEDRLTGEWLTKKEIYERQKKALERPAQFGEDPLNGIPIDLKSPLYKINQDIKTVAYMKLQTGEKKAPWQWLIQPPAPNNVRQSINYLTADYLNAGVDMRSAMSILKEVSKHHNVSFKEVLAETFRMVRSQTEELKSVTGAPKALAHLKRLEELDQNLQLVIKEMNVRGL